MNRAVFYATGIIASLMFGAIVIYQTGYFTQPEYYAPHEETSVLGENVTVGARIPRNLSFYFKPANRLPATGNDSLEISITFRPETNFAAPFTITGTTNNQGFVDFPGLSGGKIPNGNYTISVKGLSHLRRNYPNIFIGTKTTEMFDLVFPRLIAGDAHPSNDNFINSMDISYILLYLYNDNLRGDQNRDGIVNSLDLSITTSNLYVAGDE
ncbi:MAG: hypothetical protein QY314_02455 [Candidatus Dojkabacteria bacterium]|nr:MAG: hypothetical protein QY314_02455 [Candidatus Dojkabacteria bacterium]